MIHIVNISEEYIMLTLQGNHHQQISHYRITQIDSIRPTIEPDARSMPFSSNASVEIAVL